MQRTDSFSGLSAVLNAYRLKPSKGLGQNFLIDRNILEHIAGKSDLRLDEYVVEIGPGLGALTQQLLPRCLGVLAIDVDQRLRQPLQEILAEFNNFHLINENVLNVDLEATLINAFSVPQLNSFSICANIPYHITTPIIFQLLEHCPRLRNASLMMQKEVAERIMAPPGTKAYGLLTIMVAWHAEAEKLITVSKNCFYPRPKVDSTVLKITPRKQKPQCRDEALFLHLVRSAFQMRRKTMLNICVAAFEQSKSQLEKIFSVLGVNSQKRPETMTLDDFIQIADAIALSKTS